MLKTRFGLPAIVALVGLGVTHAHATVAVSSSFNLGAVADADFADGTSTTQTFSDSQSGTILPFFGTVSAIDTGADGGVITAVSSASASWSSEDAGEVIFQNIGWDVNTFSRWSTGLNDFGAAAGPIWSYTFQATADGQFNMQYDIASTGDAFGLQGAQINWSGAASGGVHIGDAFNSTANGSLSFLVSTGNTYTVSIENSANISSDGGATGYSGHMNGDFKWDLAPAVPEPATMGLGFVGLLLAIRRRIRN